MSLLISLSAERVREREREGERESQRAGTKFSPMQRRNSLIAGRYTTSSADGRRRDLCRMNSQLCLCEMPSSQTEALHWMNFISCFCYILSAQPTWSRQHRQQCNINRKLSSLRSLLRFASMRRAHYKV